MFDEYKDNDGHYYNKPNYRDEKQLIKAMISMDSKVEVAKYFEITRQTLDRNLEEQFGYIGPIEEFKQAMVQRALEDPTGSIANILVELGIVHINEPAKPPQTERRYKSYQPLYVCGNNNNLPCGLPFLAHQNNLAARNNFNGNRGGLIHTIRQF